MKYRSLVSVAVAVLLASVVAGQAVRKPSPTREPKGAMPSKPDSSERFLQKIDSQADFDSVARVYHQNTPYALPHVMFAIDRRKGNKIYYINSQKYRFHKDFLIANYFVLKNTDFFEDTYIKENRRFIVGTIAWQKPVERFTFEFWDGDLIPAEQIEDAFKAINESFFASVAFKPNSTRQDSASSDLGIERISSDDISKNQEYLALNTAKGVGRVHIIDELTDNVEIGYDEILILNEVPVTLPPVAGIIVTKPSTPLSHINLLAKGWGVPNAYIKNADKLFKELDGKFIEFETTLTEYKYKPADLEILRAYSEWKKEQGKIFKAPPSDLTVTKLASLEEMRKRESIAYGAKAANLGEVKSARIPKVTVPKGFAVPFSFYKAFLEKHGFDIKIEDFAYDYNFVHNPAERRKKLEAFRAEMQAAEFDRDLRNRILVKWRTELGGVGVFVRSSSNAEDIPDFSGAGLYTTVPNVTDEEAIIEAVKTVWASLWNFEAYEARERAFIEHKGTYMGVLLQVGVNMDSSGVLITKDPFDKENKNAIYISAKRGLGIKVVEGQKIAEQILYTKSSNAVQVLTRSGEDTLLTFDEKGGVKEVPISGDRNVLTDAVARRLADAAARIKRLFGNKVEQDIEWGYMDGEIYILQARPFIEN
ncbi:MAG: pyruvate, phosphate dikinase [Acidobacteria bacterium]|nr:MAG: pyruvate, phosphate dikinase [Acidobacteriota bacterium]REK03932.1 MAG: pyruvate, phosphate dikinase [Acidobacteriota bacterium]REK15094.1 MAG: pyruvate, phosphate dikinase [Acidobacteriota bacterium]REK46184.1 MAG: pyruvate, phosphate dikinase [Acidobacteriota bacterium]